ncbi:hypothetical protein RD792_009140 [Penstemon davidsonii]|uniref:BHLH domain-containing protein n=1 Tax=Penstemon davidsonii TaxID=160366 RepID=A0ABR0DBX9_9LAMI|nr:hypothetical protein RD792_009140 [Penstemon davidsonii]
MSTENQNQKEVLENLREQLALAVRSIEWSYAIFWSISSTKPGILEWGEGYYNGDIKTRKTVQSVEVNADHLGLQRSDQLKELYESLSLGETIPQAKRPTAALSPEDLTDAEWYFLVCMSFVFDIGQGLPGRTFAKNQMIWLCNAHRADTKVFSRAILAKASEMTIVCFPYLGGVVELGATELVQEDPNLIHHIKTSFLESPSNVPKILNRVSNNITNNNGLICEVHDHANMNDLDHVFDGPDMDTCSPDNISDDFADNLLREEPELAEAVDGEVIQIQNLPIMEDSISNCLNNSTNSSDCVSSDGNKETDNRMNGTQDQGDEIHYQSVLSSLLKGSNQLILGPYLKNGNKKASSFVSWKTDSRFSGARVAPNGTPQRLLKKVLFEVPKMHENCRVERGKQNGEKDKSPPRQAFDEIEKNHVLSERKRREKINERFLILGSLVPSGGKVDKVSVLDHTIEYLRGLERKVEELQSYKDVSTKPHDALERTSDNYGPKTISNVKKLLTKKRKTCETDKNGAASSKVRLRDSLKDNIIVNITNKDVLIEITCSWRECVLLEVMEEMSKLHLDSETVQSSNVDGMLSMTVKAKCKGVKVASESVVKQSLQKVLRKS